MMAKLENLGVKKSTVGLVVPIGYSFNLDGIHFPTVLLGKSGSPLKSGFARQALPVFPVQLRRPACQHQRVQFRLRFEDRWFAMTRLDENRAKAQLALKSGRHWHDVTQLGIWGNHSGTLYPDFFNARIGGKPVTDVITDSAWLETDFIRPFSSGALRSFKHEASPLPNPLRMPRWRRCARSSSLRPPGNGTASLYMPMAATESRRD
jgi:hypothetical protein